MKKRYLLLSVPLLLLSLSACRGGDDNISLTCEEKDFYNHTNEYDIKNQKLNTYYIDDSKLEYVSLKQFCKLLDGYLKYDDYTFSKVPFSSIYTMEFVSGNYRIRAQFDYRDDTISFNSPNIFSNTFSTASTNFMYGLNELTDSAAEGGGEVVWDLKEYFNLYYKDEQLYLPFILANTILCSENYYNIYYNGTSYNGYYESINNKDLDITTIDDKEHREANYNLIRFIMNNLYGLKDYKKINDYTELLDSYKNDLISTNYDDYIKAYKDFFVGYLDDPHTSYYKDPKYEKMTYTDYSFKEDSKIKLINDCRKELQNYKEALNITEPVDYYDDTAIIHFNDFKTGNKSEIYDSSNNVLPTAKDVDSYYFMLDCIKNIKDHGGIKNIMLDLSLSPGGNLGAMIRVLGFLTNKDIELSQIQTMNNLKSSHYFKVDSNLDGNFNDNDAETSFTWGILTSKYTYSAANLLTAIAKNHNVCKIYGEQSGGGACSVTPLVLADNSTVYISGVNALAVKNNGVYKNIEDGISVDTAVSRSNMYNKVEIDKLFN